MNKKEMMVEMVKASLAKDSLLKFMEYTWLRPRSPLIVGRHTREISAAIDKAIEKFDKGESSYLNIVVSFRHGKSDISSRFLPPYFFGRFPDEEVMQVSYGADLSEGFSKDVRKIVEGDKYRNVFDLQFDSAANNNAERHIKDHVGKYFAVGADGGATGKGSSLLIVDDFFKNREQAENAETRRKRWESLRQDFMTRLAPTHIVLVLNTRWHVDDISGNILNKNNPDHPDYDADFPVFENLHFKAIEEDGSTLFPERFSDKWYRAQKATLGDYGFASLMQGEPVLRGGNLFKVEGVQYVDEVPEGLHWVRYWDLASTEKERAKQDPDYTAGCLGAYRETADGLPQLFVKDMKECQAEAPERNAMIKTTATSDGGAVWQGVESVAGYKDSFTTLKSILKGISIVHKGQVQGDKLVRAGEVEPLFEACNIFFVRGSWNKGFMEELRQFPACTHDDRTDAMTGCFALAKERYEKMNQLGGQLGRGAV